MKNFKYIAFALLLLVLAFACKSGIDPISFVDPGPDSANPVIKITYPLDGTKIQVPELITSINIQFEATDDIELKSVAVQLDGIDLISYTQFKDYRRALEQYSYNNVTNGVHLLTIKATDLSGKVTSKSVSFEKKPPYIPIYPGEIFYMPFDGDYVEKVSFKAATKVGNPGFAGVSLKGLNSYAGATDSYLTFPMAGLKNSEFTAAFWYKANGAPDRSGLIAISPAGAANFDASRTKGLRFFREGSATSQRIKLNVGNGAGETWNDGGLIDVTANKWVHLACTVTATTCTVFINGIAVSTVPCPGIDWTGCDNMSIASGAPNFSDWGHLSDNSYYDELRIFNKALTASDIQTIIQNDSPYVAKYSGEVLYMPFEGNGKELLSNTSAAAAGSPTYTPGKIGSAYTGATNSYLTFPITTIKSANFSAVFWMKINTTPDRAGILVVSPSGAANFDVSRQKGFRFFREGNVTSQQLKSNVGTGTGESWNDGGVINPVTSDWVHVAFTSDGTKSSIYFNGILQRESAQTGVDWTGCTSLSIGSGAPNFADWGHLSDLSQIDELRMFNKALTVDEILTIYNAEK